MNNIPIKLRKELAADPFYRTCARFEALHDHICMGDPVRGPLGRMIEWEHALYFKGEQLQKKFAIVPMCWLVHRGPYMRKQIAEWIALNRATNAELDEISIAKDYRFYRNMLNEKYGPYRPTSLIGPYAIGLESAIHY